MHCRSSSKYLAIENIAGGVAEGLELKIEPEAKDSFSSSISLSMEKSAQYIKVMKNAADNAIKAWSLQKYL